MQIRKVNIARRIGLELVIILALLVISGSGKAENKLLTIMSDSLNKQEQQIACIAATTATGRIDGLKKSLNNGLDAGLTINQISEVLVQMYAYAGFPRSLTGINHFMTVLEDRKSKGIHDIQGRQATPVSATDDKYERGRKTLESLTKTPQTKPAKGFGEFSPTIDRFLKEHLFADIFDSDVLTYQQREIATIAALAGMTGVESQLQSHLNIGMNTGLTKPQFDHLFDLIEDAISKEQANAGRSVLAKLLENRK